MHTCRCNKTNALIVLAIEIIDEDVANQKMRKKCSEERKAHVQQNFTTDERTDRAEVRSPKIQLERQGNNAFFHFVSFLIQFSKITLLGVNYI